MNIILLFIAVLVNPRVELYYFPTAD